MPDASSSRPSTARRRPEPPGQGRHDPISAVPVRHPGRWVTVVVIAVLLAMLVHTLVVNPSFQWSVAWNYFSTVSVEKGVLLTLWLTVVSMVVGIAGGVLLAIMRLSPNPIVASAAWVYVWFFRGTPVLVQIIFWFNISAIFPRLSLGVPFGPSFVDVNANALISGVTAAILALGLNEAAYMSEIVRAGIISVDDGQSEAAAALGMTRLRIMSRIVLPQAMRVIVPPTGNETISMLKTTSLVSVVAVGDLLYSAQVIYTRTFQVIPGLIAASLWYIILTSILSIGQFYIERHFARGTALAARETLLEKVLRNIFGSARRGRAEPQQDSA